MTKLSKKQLIHKILSAVEAKEWSYETVGSPSQHPTLIRIFNDEESHLLKIYVWNVSHGGGGKRPQDEYRIQIKGVQEFSQNNDETTLILGWWDDLEVFVAFDFYKHSGEIVGQSPSIQIKEKALQDASINGIATYDKRNGEIAVSFKPEFFLEYLTNKDNYHSGKDYLKYEIFDESDVKDESLAFRYSISSYGADYPVDSIIKRIDNDVIFVPNFQRQYVWSQEEASRFIESLLLGLPVPGVFLSKEPDTGKLLIIDGQQRLLTLYYFFKEIYRGRKFKLLSVQEDIINKTYSELSAEDKIRFNDSIIHATIIKQDDPIDGESSIYQIFERLNSGGKKLTPQEIRACIYYGNFNELLNNLVFTDSWINIFGLNNTRLKGQELILRFFALYYNLENYEKPLKGFLNNFMSSNRNLKVYNKKELENTFVPTIDFINNTIGKEAFRIGGGLNAAIFDSVMVGLTKRLKRGPIKQTKTFKENYFKLLEDEDLISMSRIGTSNETSVTGRIQLATEFFQRLK